MKIKLFLFFFWNGSYSHNDNIPHLLFKKMIKTKVYSGLVFQISGFWFQFFYGSVALDRCLANHSRFLFGLLFYLTPPSAGGHDMGEYV